MGIVAANHAQSYPTLHHLCRDVYVVYIACHDGRAAKKTIYLPICHLSTNETSSALADGGLTTDPFAGPPTTAPAASLHLLAMLMSTTTLHNMHQDPGTSISRMCVPPAEARG